MTTYVSSICNRVKTISFAVAFDGVSTSANVDIADLLDGTSPVYTNPIGTTTVTGPDLANGTTAANGVSVSFTTGTQTAQVNLSYHATTGVISVYNITVSCLV